MKTGAKAVAVATAAERLHTWNRPRTVLGANERVRVAIIGLRGRGENHMQAYSALPNVEIAALCDIDDAVMRKRLAQVQKLGFQPKTYTDIRKGLDDKSINAVSIGLCFKWRDTIGRTPVSPVPPGVDYNWHWFWDYGNGDLGNQGIHQLDIARWGLGLGFPNKISAVGGHFMFDDDQETPNTLNCAFQYDRPNGKRMLLEFEVRHWITNHEAGIGSHVKGAKPAAETAHGGIGPAEGSYNTVGNIFYEPKGYLAIDNTTGYQTWLGRGQQPGPSAPEVPEDHFAEGAICGAGKGLIPICHRDATQSKPVRCSAKGRKEG